MSGSWRRSASSKASLRTASRKIKSGNGDDLDVGHQHTDLLYEPQTRFREDCAADVRPLARRIARISDYAGGVEVWNPVGRIPGGKRCCAERLARISAG